MSSDDLAEWLISALKTAKHERDAEVDAETAAFHDGRVSAYAATLDKMGSLKSPPPAHRCRSVHRGRLERLRAALIRAA